MLDKIQNHLRHVTIFIAVTPESTFTDGNKLRHFYDFCIHKIICLVEIKIIYDFIMVGFGKCAYTAETDIENSKNFFSFFVIVATARK